MYLLDFETKSSTDIKLGYNRYCQDPDADILCLTYGHLDHADPLEWWPQCGWGLSPEFVAWVNEGGLVAASNAPFDQSIWEYLAVLLYGFPEMKADQWYCTQAQTRVAGLPSKLDDAARALGLKMRKGRRGKTLIQKMSIPPFEHTPALLAEMRGYCVQDWRVMRDQVRATPLLTQTLFEHYQVNQRINERGVKIDRAMATAAHVYATAERDEIGAKLAEVTAECVDKPTQHQRFKKWLMALLAEDGCEDALKLMVRYTKGEKKFSSDKRVRANMLADPVALGIEPVIVKALQLMDDASGSATSKFGKMALLAEDDDRVRGSIRAFGAASTLRYSSMGLQLHNFKRDTFPLADVKHFRAQMLEGMTLTDPDTGKPVRVMETLGKLLRAAIIPEDGHVFVVGDWSAVQSMLTAWLARDERKLDVFRRRDCPYCYAAEAIYGRPINKEDDPAEREVGKVLDLAAGFLGGQGALANMAASHGIYIAEDERQKLIDDWRAMHPKIVNYGNLLVSRALAAMRDVGRWKEADRVAYLFDGSALYCRLPDGETLIRYPEARVEMQPVPWDENDLRPTITALKAAFTMAQDADEWPRHALWRGLLLENIAQASEAILLRDQVKRSEKWVIFHSHDEVILEVLKKFAEALRVQLRKEMETPPGWCADLPLIAEPSIMTVYGK